MPAVLTHYDSVTSLVTLGYLFEQTCAARDGWSENLRQETLQAIGGFPPEHSLPVLTKCLQRADELGDAEVLNLGELILRGEEYRALLAKQTLTGLSSNVFAIIQRARDYVPPPEPPPPPPKPNYFTPMLKELSDLGYNLEMDDETYDRIRDDLVKYVWTETEEMFTAGKISYDEMERLQAQRYKEWFLKNMKPTLPPKTNDTSTVTTPVAP